MAVAIAKQTTPAAVSGSGNTVTFPGTTPIGTASNDRMVVVTPTSEDATAGAVTKVTVGGIPLVQCAAAQFAAMNASVWWGSVPTGTQAAIVVTYTGTAPVSGSNLISVFAVTGADVGLSTFGSHTSTDMDVTAPLTLATTVPASGGVIAAACGATSSSAAKAWGGNITEAEEVAATNYCHTTATGTTAGATTITCTGGTNLEDGALAVAVFRTASGKPQNRQSYWPLPKGLQRLAQTVLNTWANELNLPLNTAPTYLPSVASWGPPPPDVRHPNVLQTWANELNLPLNVPADAPFSKRDWSLPQGFATKGGAWINPAIKAAVELPDTTNLPSMASGWSVPPALPPTFSFVRSGNALGTVVVPFNKLSWPNPRAAKRANALLTWSNGLPPIQFVGRAPLIARRVYQSWHVALKPQPVNLLPLTAIVDTTVYLPSVATSWTIPASLPPLNQSFTRPLSLPLNVVLAAAPFNKTDWPNPRAAQRPDGLSWVSSPHALQRPDLKPFGKSDWTVPAGQAPQSHSFTLSYNLPLNTPAGPAPFNQLSWPNPRAPERSVAHRGWVYSAPPVPDLNVYLPSTVMGWPVPRGLRPLHLQILIGNSQICLNPPEVVVPPEPDFPPHPPPTDSGGAGIKSGVWKPGQKGKRENYRSYRFITEKEIEQLTGREIRQSARDLRADVRKDPLAEEVQKEIAALSRVVDVLADMDRLESSIAELSRAIEYARRARAEAEADDEEVSFLLLS